MFFTDIRTTSYEICITMSMILVMKPVKYTHMRVYSSNKRHIKVSGF